jgi:amino acid adenylation domain-containing protein/non-ribosomal peptide synthase protein (TIGR01720 family)
MIGSNLNRNEQLRELAKRLASLDADNQALFARRLTERGIDIGKLPIVGGPRSATTPCSFAQRQLWLIDRLEPGSSLYNLPSVLELRGRLDVAALERALLALVERHEVLRTRFEEREGEPVQLLEPPTLALPLVDLSGLPPAEREREAERLALAHARVSFDLQTGPMLKVQLLRLGLHEHWLLVTMHHIVSDEWSDAVLVAEMSELYRANVEGGPSELDPLPIQYSDYASWQRRWVAGPALEQQLTYWRQQLAGDDYALLLPTDFPRPQRTSERGGRHAFGLGRKLTDEVAAFSRERGATLFMTLLSAFQILLRRYSGQADIRVGVPTAQRTRAEVEGLVGYFANVQVLRSQVDEAESFVAHLERTRTTVADAQAHQELPFERLVEALQPPRRTDRTPLFQVMFSWHRSVPTSHRVTGELELIHRVASEPDAKFDLTLHMTEPEASSGAAELTAEFVYRAELFAPETLRRMEEHLRLLLQQAVTHPNWPVARLESISASERTRAINTWNDSAVVYAPWISVHASIEIEAARRSDTEAVVFERERLSYRELEERACAVAERLWRSGVRRGARVGLVVPRSADAVVAVFAVLKCGAAYVPLEATAPIARLRELCQDSGVVAVIGEEAAERACAGLNIAVFAPHSTECAASFRSVAVSPDDAAYVIYTSGSTGRAKGVVVTHGALRNYVEGVLDRLSLPQSARLALVSTMAADLGNTVLFGALCSGRTLHLLSEERVLDPDAMAEHMRTEAIDVLKIVPSHLQGLLQAATPEHVLPRHTLILGGERTSWQLVERIQQLGVCRLVNHYGPTETTVGVLTYHHREPRSDTLSGLPLGAPLPNSRVYVLDARLQPPPLGVPGELYVAGAGVAQGYLNRPELTAERFVPDPFGPPGGRAYRTGDRGKHLQDGAIEFLGRVDDQIKLRGYRIELGEIRAVLLRAAGVTDAHVVFDDEAGGRLVAFVVGRTGPELEAHVAARLPSYMLPSDYVQLESLPLTPNGKIDRVRLLAGARRTEARLSAPPETDNETRLAAIWQSVLKVDAVSREGNFFSLGGDSILALQVVARARRVGLKVTPKQLFEHKTLMAVAAVAEPVQPVARAAVHTAPTLDSLPLTPIQRWFFGQDFEAPQHWNQSLLLEVADKLDQERFERALGLVLARHDAFQLRYRREGSRWVQRRVADSKAALVRTVELGSVDDWRGAVERIANGVHREIHLERGPLLIAIIITRAPEDGDLLLLVAHHLVVDGVSWRILLSELSEGYAQLSAGERVDLPEITSTFQQWSEALHGHASSAALASELAYWRALLEPGEPALPSRSPAARNTVGSARTVSVELSAQDTSELLLSAPLAYRSSIHELLLVALAHALAEWAERDTVLVEVEGHGREDLLDGLDVSRTLGWFTTLYPVRLSPDRSDLGASIKGIKEQLRSTPSRGLGYGVLRYAEGDAGASLPHVQPQVTFNYLGQFDQLFEPGGWLLPISTAVGEERDLQSLRRSCLDVGALVWEGRLRIDFTYSENLHDRQTVEGLGQAFLQHLQRIRLHCLEDAAGALTPSDFALKPLSQRELDGLRVAARNVDDIYPLTPTQGGLLFHSLLEAGSGVYLSQQTCAVDSELDLPAFEEAWRGAIKAHPVLRTSFCWENLAEPVQVVHREVKWHITDHQLSGETAEERREQLASWLQAERERGFDLAHPPLLRVQFLRWGTNERAASAQLVWTVHHLLLDGWSSTQLLHEVFERYAALREGRPTRLPHGAPFVRYVAWLRQQSREKAESYWREQLDGFDAPTLLATELGGGTPGGGRETIRRLLSRELSESLQSWCRQHQLTLNTVFQGAVAILLQCYSRQRDVLFGVTVSGRDVELPGVVDVMGLLIATLPVRAQLAPNSTLLTFLQGLQSRNVELREHSNVSLAELPRLAQRSSRQPLFDTLLVFENYSVDDALAGLEQKLGLNGATSSSFTNYPLTLVVVPGEPVRLQLDYDLAHVSEEAARRVIEQLERLLQLFVARPAARLWELGLIHANERERLLQAGGAASLRVAGSRCLDELVEERARLAPNDRALCFGDEIWSYAELSDCSNRLARKLVELGVQADDLVGVAIQRSPRLVVALLAVLKAGAGYLPLDANMPRERLASLLGDAKPRVVLTDTVARGALPEVTTAWCVERDWSELDVLDGLAPPRCARSEAVAYCIFTSGSTGRPKGTLVTHASLVNHMDWMRATFDVDRGDRVLQKTSIVFDASVWEFWLPLLLGGTLVLASPDAGRDLSALARDVLEQKISVLQVVPSMLTALLETPAGKQAVSRLDYLFCGGEVLPPQLLQEIADLPRSPRVVNLYGPTESCIDATFFDCSGWEPGARVPIGRPIVNVQALVLDDVLSLAPELVTGELYLAGAGLARGYLEQPSLTAERFVPNPYGQRPGERLYRTGDLAAFRADGLLEYRGRTDHQVKLRGYRIELGEVEKRLAQLDGVQGAVVSVSGVGAGARLVAHVVVPPAVDQETELRSALRVALSRQLPEYMVPSVFIFMDALPLTPSGKVDRRALPAADATEAQSTHAPPRNELERILVRLWQETLGVQSVGIHDDFFDLGGHSLSMTRLASRIRSELAVELSLRRLFEVRTVAALAEVIDAMRAETISEESLDLMSEALGRLEQDDV